MATWTLVLLVAVIAVFALLAYFEQKKSGMKLTLNFKKRIFKEDVSEFGKATLNMLLYILLMLGWLVFYIIDVFKETITLIKNGDKSKSKGKINWKK